MDIHLYLMCFRHESLVASHLAPEEFATYMAVGARKKTRGYVMFVELDPNFDSPELHLDRLTELCAPHADGSPRHSKYLSVYRVLERIPLSACGKLYLTTRDGCVLALDHEDSIEPDEGPFMYTELCPLTPRVVTTLKPSEFCKELTSKEALVSVPRILFADMLVERDQNGRLASRLPYQNPRHIEDCLEIVGDDPEKTTKTVDRAPALNAFYRTIASGFYLGDQTGMKSYRFPSRDELETEHYGWWRSASLG